MAERITESSMQWWEIDLELSCRASNLLEVHKRLNLVTPADLVAIVGVKGAIFEKESRDSVLMLELERFHQVCSDMPDASFTWGAFYFCTRQQHQLAPILRREPEGESLLKCQYQIRCLESWALQIYTQNDMHKDLLDRQYKILRAVQDVPQRLTYGDG